MTEKIDLRSRIRTVPHFPKEGVMFKDITTLLQDSHCFRYAIKEMLERFKGRKIDKVVSAESRGFIFAPIALHLNAGLVIVRKSGKLPRETHMIEYDLEYGNAQIEIHVDCMDENDVALIVDDVLATGGTAEAAGKLTTLTGAKVAGYQFLIELDALNGREKLKEPVHSVLHY